jgi:hypothetical protein
MIESKGFERSYVTGSVPEFQRRVADNLIRLTEDTGDAEFAIPIALFLVIDEESGGDNTAKEIAKRFGLLDVESRDVIDFFFLGWRRSADGKVSFDLSAFTECRNALRKVGVRAFGGNADLFVLDVWMRRGVIELDFTRAMHVDLAETKAKGTITTAGGFLQGLIDAAESVRTAAKGESPTFRISDRLGLASAKQSFVDFVLDKWGVLLGAKKLADLVTRNVGPVVDLARL